MLHEIALSGNFLHRLGIGLQLMDACLMVRILPLVVFNLFIQFADALFVAQMGEHAAGTYKTY